MRTRSADEAIEVFDMLMSDLARTSANLAAKWKRFERTVAGAPDGSVVLDITGRWNAYPSLGKVYHPDGVTVTNAGNEVRLKLMKVKGHNGQGRGGFTIMTSFPTGVAP